MFTRSKNAVRTKSEPIRATDIKSIPALNEKLYFLQFNEEDTQILREISSIIQEHAELISKRHYDMLCSLPETKKMINQYSSEQQFLSTYKKYVLSLADVVFDESYLHVRKQIGCIHSHIKLSSEWFIASFSRFYEYLFPAIIDSLPAHKASKAVVSLSKLLTLDAQIALEAYEEAHDFKFVKTNSEIIETIVEIDKMGPLLDSVSISMNETMNISAATQELAASVQEVATHAMKVAENSEEMVVSAREGQQSINSTLQGIINMVDDFQQARKQFIELNNSVEQMTNVVSFISEVADQTNLLALNAAIEAARAGEEGRGFAVVASEVRKLSEQTRQSVEQIRRMINTVQNSASIVDDITLKMEQSITEKSAQTQGAIDSLDHIIEQIMNMGDTTSNIAAIIEEQSAATDDISNRSVELIKQMQIIENNSNETGKALYDVSIKVNNLRNDTIKYMNSMSDEHLIRIVKTDHLLWRWWVYNSILGYHTLNLDIVADASQCRLGKWYNEAKSNARISAHAAFSEVEIPHEKIHQQVKEVGQHLLENNRNAALAGLSEIEASSNEIVIKLDELTSQMKSRR